MRRTKVSSSIHFISKTLSYPLSSILYRDSAFIIVYLLYILSYKIKNAAFTENIKYGNSFLPRFLRSPVQIIYHKFKHVC